MSSSGREDKIEGEEVLCRSGDWSAPPLASSDAILPWLGSKDLGLGQSGFAGHADLLGLRARVVVSR